jgi:hypothetical protein
VVCGGSEGVGMRGVAWGGSGGAGGGGLEGTTSMEGMTGAMGLSLSMEDRGRMK